MEGKLNANESTITGPAELVELVYELLDAHGDTMRLAEPNSCDSAWEAHLDYLRSLQRVSRETLARVTGHLN